MPPSGVDDALDTTAAAVGRRIKTVRSAQRLTIEALAEASGLTKSFLSKIERGRATASVAALLRISEALGLPLSSLFENAATRHVVRATDYPRVSFGGHQLSEFMLTPVAERRAQVLLSRIQPGGGSGEDFYPLPGEVEFAYVIRGRLELAFSDDTVILGPGDAITFDPSMHRSFRVAGDSEPTEVLWMICPALPHQVFRS